MKDAGESYKLALANLKSAIAYWIETAKESSVTRSLNLKGITLLLPEIISLVKS